MKFSALSFVLLAVACGGPSKEPATPTAEAPADAPAETPEPPQNPEVIERVLDDSKDIPPDYECTAARPETGVVDPTSTEIERLVIEIRTQHIVEKVKMRSGQSIEISIGGCAHYGNYFSTTLDAEKPITEVEHYLLEALSVFDALPYRKDANTGLGEIHELIDKSRADPKAMAECDFPDGQGFARASCTLETVGPGVKVDVWRDLAL